MRAFVSAIVLGLLGLLMISPGCGSSRPRAGGLLEEINRYERDIRTLSPNSTAAELLRMAEEKRDKGRALLEKGKEKQAALLFEESLADSKAALAVAEADGAAREEDTCLRAAARTREAWQEAMNVLIQTEQVARTTASTVPHKAKEPADLSMPSFPEETLSRLTTHDLDPSSLRQAWRDWQDAAALLSVSVADLERELETNLEAAEKAKAGSPEYARHLLFALRAVQTLEARVRAASSHRLCAQAADLATELGSARDAALRGTLELERGLKDDLRSQLEKVRSEARTRQQELNDALKQIEGQFARIHQEARGTIVSLSDILFDFDKATLKRNVEFNLVRVATILNQFPEMFISVEGHTDNIGTAEYNLDLSKRRAQAVHDFLVSQGVAAERMTVEGYGMTRPVEDNSTEAGRQKNRRVDLVINSDRQ